MSKTSGAASEPKDTDTMDLDIKSIADAFPTHTQNGATLLLERLTSPTSDATLIATRQSEVRRIRQQLRTHRDAIRGNCRALKEAEAAVVSIAEARADTRNAEYYEQILWSPNSMFKRFNESQFIVGALVFLRTILLPGMSCLLPLFVFIAPFVMYYVVQGRTFSVAEYMTMLQQSFSKVMPSILGRPRFTGRGGPLEMGEKALHLGASVGMFAVSIWNQVSAARTMRRVVADIDARAEKYRAYVLAVRELGTLIGHEGAAGLSVPPAGNMALFGNAWNSPDIVRNILRVGGECDMLVAIASLRRTCFAKLGADRMELLDLYHPGAGAKPVLNTVRMGGEKRAHVILTGPNRGGKSTLLKSVGTAALMAQTVGVVFARRARLPLFQHIIVALNPTDVLGKMSLFEAEIEFAKQVRATVRNATGPVFLMMDEIFHGTNANDGTEASRVFLDDLYRTPNVFSMISTHYLGLPELYGKDMTQNLCMSAAVDPENADRLVYSYRLEEGVNGFSSVREILRERGLLSP